MSGEKRGEQPWRKEEKFSKQKLKEEKAREEDRRRRGQEEEEKFREAAAILRKPDEYFKQKFRDQKTGQAANVAVATAGPVINWSGNIAGPVNVNVQPRTCAKCGRSETEVKIPLRSLKCTHAPHECRICTKHCKLCYL